MKESMQQMSEESPVAWFMRGARGERGPLDLPDLMELARTGELRPTDQVRRGQSGPWLPASTVRGLFPDCTPPFDVFVSYSFHNKSAVDQIVRHLEHEGIRCWVAPRDVPVGMAWSKANEGGMNSSRFLLLVVSQHSNTNQRILQEVRLALALGLLVVPFRIEDLPYSHELDAIVGRSSKMDAFSEPLEVHSSELAREIRRLREDSAGGRAIGDSVRHHLGSNRPPRVHITYDVEPSAKADGASKSDSQVTLGGPSPDFIAASPRIAQPDPTRARCEPHAGNEGATIRIIDNVHFGASAPETVKAGSRFVLGIWAFLEEARKTVALRVAEESGGPMHLRTAGPVPIARGTTLQSRVSIAGLRVTHPIAELAWTGEVGNATFAVEVPHEAADGAHAGTAEFLVHGALVARLDFIIAVGVGSDRVRQVPGTETSVRTAFASYSSEDREQVLYRVQGIESAGVQVFVDVDALRAGQNWQTAICREIDARDVLYLFWSQAAARSSFVDQEWRYAYQRKGARAIDPVPLDPPAIVPPPQELAKEKHFNDRWLAHQALARRTRRRWWRFLFFRQPRV